MLATRLGVCILFLFLFRARCVHSGIFPSSAGPKGKVHRVAGATGWNSYCCVATVRGLSQLLAPGRQHTRLVLSVVPVSPNSSRELAELIASDAVAFLKWYIHTLAHT